MWLWKRTLTFSRFSTKHSNQFILLRNRYIVKTLSLILLDRQCGIHPLRLLKWMLCVGLLMLSRCQGKTSVIFSPLQASKEMNYEKTSVEHLVKCHLRIYERNQRLGFGTYINAKFIARSNSAIYVWYDALRFCYVTLPVLQVSFTMHDTGSTITYQNVSVWT